MKEKLFFVCLGFTLTTLIFAGFNYSSNPATGDTFHFSMKKVISSEGEVLCVIDPNEIFSGATMQTDKISTLEVLGIQKDKKVVLARIESSGNGCYLNTIIPVPLNLVKEAIYRTEKGSSCSRC